MSVAYPDTDIVRTLDYSDTTCNIGGLHHKISDSDRLPTAPCTNRDGDYEPEADLSPINGDSETADVEYQQSKEANCATESFAALLRESGGGNGMTPISFEYGSELDPNALTQNDDPF